MGFRAERCVQALELGSRRALGCGRAIREQDALPLCRVFHLDGVVHVARFIEVLDRFAEAGVAAGESRFRVGFTKRYRSW